MKRYCTKNESPRPFKDPPDPDALPPPRGPDSPAFRLVLNGGDPYLRRVAELVRRLWIKQRPREDAEAVLAQVNEDLTEGRYALRHLTAYLNAFPLVASPCQRLAEMIADYYGLNDRTKRSRAAGSLARRASPAPSDANRGEPFSPLPTEGEGAGVRGQLPARATPHLATASLRPAVFGHPLPQGEREQHPTPNTYRLPAAQSAEGSAIILAKSQRLQRKEVRP